VTVDKEDTVEEEGSALRERSRVVTARFLYPGKTVSIKLHGKNNEEEEVNSEN